MKPSARRFGGVPGLVGAVAVAGALGGGCEAAPSVPPGGHVATEAAPKAVINTEYTRLTGVRAKRFADCSGTVVTEVYRCVSPSSAEFQDVICKIPEDKGLVLVGGGANVDHGNFGYPGAFLVESNRNFEDPDAWEAASKSHQGSYPHKLEVYAIGLRINGVSPEQLRGNLRVDTEGSAWAEQTAAWTYAPQGRLAISGGVTSNSLPTERPGHLLQQTYLDPFRPAGGAFYASTTSYLVPDEASLAVSIFSLPASIGGVDLELVQNEGGSWSNSGSAMAEVDVGRIALTSIQAQTHDASGAPAQNRFLFDISLYNHSWGDFRVKARSRDHLMSSAGGTHLRAFGLKAKVADPDPCVSLD
jgi:hypothetical protein